MTNFKIIESIINGKIHPEINCASQIPQLWPPNKLIDDNDENVYYHVTIDKNSCAYRFKYDEYIYNEYNKLNSDQRKVFMSVLSNKYNFLSAPAGSGKSFLIETISNILGYFLIPIAITSTTKRSSDNICGNTIHSYTGIGYNTGTVTHILKKMSKVNRAFITNTQLLIIDEISMISSYFIEKMDALFKIIRKNKSRFGGMRVFLCGDMLQLPMVRKQNEARREIFDIPWWNEVGFVYCRMDIIMRQDDPGFIHALNEIRTHIGYPANMSISTIDVIKSMIRPCDMDDPEITYLSGLHKECTDINNRMARNMLLLNANFEFETRTVGCCDRSNPVIQTITLCKGIKVITTSNMYSTNGLSTITNGTVGVIVDFIRYEKGLMVSNETNLPVQYSCYGSINNNGETHQSQPSQTKYGLPTLTHDNIYCVHEKLVTIDTQINNFSNVYPVIDVCGKRCVVGNYVKYEYVFNESTECNNVLKIITGIPLKIAYAVTVHFAQGCTLNKIAINVYSLFERQHFYTAISRVRKREDIFIIPSRSYTDKQDTNTDRSVSQVLIHILRYIKYTDPVILRHLEQYYGKETDTVQTSADQSVEPIQTTI